MVQIIQYLAVATVVIFSTSQMCAAGDIIMLVNEVKSERSLPFGRLSVKSTFPIEEVARKCADEPRTKSWPCSKRGQRARSP